MGVGTVIAKDAKLTSVRDIGSFIRWRLIPVRYATMLMGLPTATTAALGSGQTKITAVINKQGYHAGPTLDDATVTVLRDIYLPRGRTAVTQDRGAPFVNLVTAEDFTIDHPLMRVAFSHEIFDAAVDYFGGRLMLDSIQVLHSFPSKGPLRESQYWHKDYGDRKSFHCVAYLNDVLTADKGPFVYVDKEDSKRIKKSAIIRRIDDEQFKRELGDGTIRAFYGKAGESVFVDPAVCYHYGSRCTSEPRMAIFVTFNSATPFVRPSNLVQKNAERLAEIGAQLRPDLNPSFLRSILRLR